MEQMIDEKLFYEELGNIPDVPQSLYSNIEKDIRFSRFSVYKWVALAALVILSIGVPALIQTSGKEQVDIVDADIASELQFVHDYLNGYDIEENFEISALW